MSAVHVTFPGGKRVDASFNGQIIHTDQSVLHGGEGAAAEPFDLFLASLAACAGFYVLAFCQARGISTEGIAMTQENVFDGAALREVRLSIDLPVSFPEKYAHAVGAAAAACRVKKVLADPPRVSVQATRRV